MKIQDPANSLDYSTEGPHTTVLRWPLVRGTNHFFQYVMVSSICVMRQKPGCKRESYPLLNTNYILKLCLISQIFIQHLECARHSAQPFVKTNSFNPHNNPAKQRLLSLSFYRSRKRSTGKWRNFLKVKCQYLVTSGSNPLSCTHWSGGPLGWELFSFGLTATSKMAIIILHFPSEGSEAQED